MADKKTFTVNVGSLNLRAEPDMSARVVRVLTMGEKVTKTTDSAPDGWMAVKGGYVMRDYLK